MFPYRRLIPALIMLSLLVACSTPAPSPSTSESAVATSSATATAVAASPSAAAAAWPGVAGQIRDNLLELGALCGTQEEAASGFTLLCGLTDDAIEFTVSFRGDIDGSLNNMEIVILDTAVAGFANAEDSAMQQMVVDIAAPLFAASSLPVVSETLANYWSFAGTGTSITPPDENVTFTFAELNELMPADSTIIIDFAPAEGTSGPVETEEGFAFGLEDVLAYYTSQGFTCADAQADIVADHEWTNCFQEDGDLRKSITLTADGDGVLADAIASVSRADGEQASEADALSHLTGFLGATMGDAGVEAAAWLGDNFGASTEMEAVFSGLQVVTYTGTGTNPGTLVVQTSTPEYSAAYDAAN